MCHKTLDPFFLSSPPEQALVITPSLFKRVRPPQEGLTTDQRTFRREPRRYVLICTKNGRV